MLLMALPNENLITFNQYKDAKTLFVATQTRFGGNEATKKTQKSLLKQIYENFYAPSTESLDSIFNRLQKIVSHLAIIDTMSFDNLYNNFKIVEKEVKGTSKSSSSSSSQNMAFVSSPSSTNEVNTAYGISTANTQKTGRMITINGSETAGYDMSKMECFSYHKLGLFTKECRQLTNQDRSNMNQDSSRRTINVEETASNLMVAIDGAGFDWSYTADDDVPTNMTLMAFLDSKLDLSNSGLKEFQQLEFEGYGPKTSKNVITKIEFVRPKQQEKPVRKPVKYDEIYRSQCARGNQRNWNNQKSQQLRSGFVMYNKACFVCESFNHLQANCNYHQRERVGHPQKEDQGYLDSGCSRHMTGICPISLTSRNLMKDRLPLGEEPKEEKLLVKELLKVKVKIIRCDNETEFKNRVMGEFYEKKGIKKEFSVARTPQQNGVAERRNRTLIEADRTMLDDSKLSSTFWSEVINTACYVQNRVLVVKPHNKTPYELFRGRTRVLSFMIPFGCHVTILNTLDHLGKFDGKYDDGFFVGYSLNSDGPKWLFDIDALTKSMNYVPVVTDGSLYNSSLKNANNDKPQTFSDAGKKNDEGVSKESGIDDQKRPENSTQDVNTDGPSINTTNTSVNTKMDISNISTTYLVPSTPNTRIHKDHSLDHVIGDVYFGVQTRRMTKTTSEKGFISVVYERKTHKDLHTCLFTCFLSQEEPKKVIQALKDPTWIEAMQEELLQFKLQQGHIQEERIDYDEVFASVARIEAIRMFLAHASFKDFVVYQMDVKSAFLYGKIEEEVYVCQPRGFEDPEFSDRVYKVEKALYGLHQALRAWKDLCTEFDKMMQKNFQMSSIGELTFFLGMQVTQKDDGVFTSQDKYVDEILKKFGFSTVKTTSTPIETSKPLLKDENAEDGPVVQGEGSTYPVESYHTPTGDLSTSQLDFSPTLRIPIRQETKVPQPSSHPHTNVADEDSGNIDKTLSMPRDSPLPRVNTLGSDEGSTTLSKKVDSLEKDLKQTKQIYGAAYTKLIKKIQGRNRHDMEVDTAKPIYTASAAVTTVSTASPTRVSTTDDITMVEILVYIKKSTTKDKEAAMRLQAEIDEEERQRIAKVHEIARSFNIEEREDIQARVKADEELDVRLQAEEKGNYTKSERSRMLIEFIRGYTMLELRGYYFDEIKTLFEKRMRMVNTFVPMETKVRRGVPELVADSSQVAAKEAKGTKRAVEEELGHQSSKKQKSDELSLEGLQQLMIISQKHTHHGNRTWRLYDTCGVHHVSTKDGVDIYMLVEREYMLSRDVLTLMLVGKLMVDQHSEMANELL
nr:hypothetical protein [Tanacetum cinerariifolium]